MIFDVEVIKDIWDFFDIIVTAICGLISLILIYACSAMLSDKNKKYEKEFNSLNYLVICINRYMKHLLGILSVISTKQKEINDYFASTNDENKFKAAFQIITPPMVNFKVKLTDYAFTVKKQPKILDYLLNYIENYSLVIQQIDLINNESYYVLEQKVGSNESIKIAARYHMENLETNNLLKLKMSTCFTLSLLNLLLQTVQKYQEQYKYKGYTRIYFHETQISKIIEAENFVTKFIGNEYWKNDLQDSDEFDNKTNFFNNIFSITNKNNHKIINILGLKIKIKLNSYRGIKEKNMECNTENNCKNCEKQKKLLYKQFKNSAEDIGRYISIICSIFYVSLITIYTQTSTYFTQTNKKFFIINFIISVGIFVLYEIFKMLLSYKEYQEKARQWGLFYQNQIDISELENSINKFTVNLYKHHIIIWKFVFAITMICGILAFISLLWGILIL